MLVSEFFIFLEWRIPVEYLPLNIEVQEKKKKVKIYIATWLCCNSDYNFSCIPKAFE